MSKQKLTSCSKMKHWKNSNKVKTFKDAHSALFSNQPHYLTSPESASWPGLGWQNASGWVSLLRRHCLEAKDIYSITTIETVQPH